MARNVDATEGTKLAVISQVQIGSECLVLPLYIELSQKSKASQITDGRNASSLESARPITTQHLVDFEEIQKEYALSAKCSVLIVK